MVFKYRIYLEIYTIFWFCGIDSVCLYIFSIYSCFSICCLFIWILFDNYVNEPRLFFIGWNSLLKNLFRGCLYYSCWYLYLCQRESERSIYCNWDSCEKMNKNFIPTINISSIIKNNPDKKKINLTIKKIKNACINVCFIQSTVTRININ